LNLPDALVTGYFLDRRDYFRPWIAMAAAHVKAAAAIIKRNGFTADFSDFAIAIPWTDARVRHISHKCVLDVALRVIPRREVYKGQAGTDPAEGSNCKNRDYRRSHWAAFFYRAARRWVNALKNARPPLGVIAQKFDDPYPRRSKVTSKIFLWALQQIGRLSNVDRDPPRLVAGRRFRREDRIFGA
jgi:hypothetical protein